MKLSAKDISKIEFQGKKIRNLATLSGWNKTNNVELQLTPS